MREAIAFFIWMGYARTAYRCFCQAAMLSMWMLLPDSSLRRSALRG